ncbi:hypothetical protein NE237_002879 [Protea cynaroides]|uniref:HTH myb-type domain-containing protein n=1 Tax=Protea cynaroides TaxID=273540 RepID=A0A9Q0QS24_9MAGN|nr:hypothetical protein NE237_002879 [Protea cynaroides]
MYHQQHHHHQRKNKYSPSSRMSIPSERHLFLQGGNGPGDTGLVLPADAKPRLKWTPELHKRFIEAVNQLGGADKATPKTVMKLMGIPGLTLYHLKIHLRVHCQSLPNVISIFEIFYRELNHLLACRHTDSVGIFMDKLIWGPARSVQQHLQLRIEALGKHLQSVLEKAKETLGKQNIGPAGLEAAKVQLSELASKVSTECLNSTLSDLKEMQGEKKHDSCSFYEGTPKGDEDEHFFHQNNTTRPAIEPDYEKTLKEFRLPCLTAKLDLNAHDENDASSSCKQFDLNGFSWS